MEKNHWEAENLLRSAGKISFRGVPIKMDWARKFQNNRAKIASQSQEHVMKNNKTVLGKKHTVEIVSKQNFANIRTSVTVPPHSNEDCSGEQMKKDRISIEMEDKWEEMVNLSFTVNTFEDFKLDSFREIIHNIGWNFVKIMKLDKSCFLYTFLEKETMEQVNWKDIDMWVESSTKTVMADLVIPRLAWLNIIGLPYIITTEKVLKPLIGSISKLVYISSDLDTEQLFPVIQVGITTRCVDKIKVSKEVLLENMVFEIMLQEGEKNQVINSGQKEMEIQDSVSSWLDSVDASKR